MYKTQNVNKKMRYLPSSNNVIGQAVKVISHTRSYSTVEKIVGKFLKSRAVALADDKVYCRYAANKRHTQAHLSLRQNQVNLDNKKYIYCIPLFLYRPLCKIFLDFSSSRIKCSIYLGRCVIFICLLFLGIECYFFLFIF